MGFPRTATDRQARWLGGLGLPAMAAGLALRATSCVSPGPGKAAEPDGRRLYLTCSGSCHSPEPIDKYSRAQWERILPEMSREARLPLERERVLRDFVFARLGP